MADRIVYAPLNSPAKKRSSLRGKFFIAAAVFLFLFIVASAVYAIQFPEWQIKNIEISGFEVLKEEEIFAEISGAIFGEYALFIPKSSFFLVSGKKIKQTLAQKFPRIETIQVNTRFPNGLSVQIKERKLWGIFCGAQKCAYIDKNGIVYEEAPNSYGSLILKIKSDVENFSVPSRALDDLTIQKMDFLSSGLKEKVGLEVTGFELFTKILGEIRVAVSDGFIIYFNRDDDLDNAFGVIKTVLEEEIKDKRGRLEYIDVRFGNKVFYKLR